jgi:energy-coupling factor transporter transmembrane protein EcfT
MKKLLLVFLEYILFISFAFIISILGGSLLISLPPSLKYLVFLIPFFLSFFVFGMFDGMQTARKDYPSKSIFWKHDEDDWQTFCIMSGDEVFRNHVMYCLTNFTSFDLWFLGGNTWYDPSYLFTSDFWHFAKHGWLWSFSIICVIIVAIILNLNLPSYVYLLYLFLGKVEGVGFIIFYHYIFRKDKPKLWDLMRNKIFGLF